MILLDHFDSRCKQAGKFQTLRGTLMKKLVLTIAAAALLPAVPAMAAGAAGTAASAATSAAKAAATRAARAAATRAAAPVVNKVNSVANTVAKATGTAAATPAATTPAATAPAVAKPAVTTPAATAPAVATTPAATTPAAAPAAAAKPLFSISDSTIGTLLDNPTTKAILQKHLPALVGNPQIDMARGMTLTQVQPMAGGLLSDDILAKIAADLLGIK
jgi:hypothetical protein